MNIAARVRVMTFDGTALCYVATAEIAEKMLTERKAIYTGAPGCRIRHIRIVEPQRADAVSSQIERQRRASIQKARKQAGVSKHKKDKRFGENCGSWVVRMDNARSGWAGGEHSIVFTPPGARLGSGTAEQPATQ